MPSGTIRSYLAVEYFETDANRWVVETIKEYFVEFKSTPTSTVFKVKLNEVENEVGYLDLAGAFLEVGCDQ